MIDDVFGSDLAKGIDYLLGIDLEFKTPYTLMINHMFRSDLAFRTYCVLGVDLKFNAYLVTLRIGATLRMGWTTSLALTLNSRLSIA